MTNGEKIKELFPHFDVEDKTEYFGRIRNLDDHFIKADIDFWNAEYKEPTTKNDIRDNRDKNELNRVKDELEPTTKNNLALIHTEGLDEGIRCAMCTNYMKSDRGCDGSCVVDKDMYKAVMETIEKHIQPTTKNNLGVDAVNQEPRKGHWIDREIYDADRWKCSECGRTEQYKENYCPKCGAKMESEG